MKNTPTYTEQWQKITSAYVNEKLDPMDGCACFIGNMLGNNDAWERGRASCSIGNFYVLNNTPKNVLDFLEVACGHFYTMQEIVDMENNFLSKAMLNGDWGESYKDEDSLYLAMTTTLEMLRQIHEAKGDETAKEIVLEKRVLHTA